VTALCTLEVVEYSIRVLKYLIIDVIIRFNSRGADAAGCFVTRSDISKKQKKGNDINNYMPIETSQFLLESKIM
jgi:hypothetical protein